MLGKLRYAVVKRIGRITDNKSSGMSLEGSHVWYDVDDDKNATSNGITSWPLYVSVDAYPFRLSLTRLSATLFSGPNLFVILFIMITNPNDESRHFHDILQFNLSNPQPYASSHQHMETLLMELHSTCGSNSLWQSPILIQLIHTHQEESFYGWMVATDPSEDVELQTTRLQMTSVPCLGLILQCPSFLTHSFPFMVYVSLYRQSLPIYPYMITSLMWTFTPMLFQTLSYCSLLYY